VKKNLIILLLIVGVVVTISVNHAEAISPKLQDFLEDLENRITQLEHFDTYQINSGLMVIPFSEQRVRGTVHCYGNDSIINASYDTNALNLSFSTWKINGNTLDYFARGHEGQSFTLEIFLTCKS